MLRMKTFFLFLSICISSVIYAQKIIYSDPDRDDIKSMNFDIIGKIGNHFIVYKNVRNNYRISRYDSNMKIADNIELDFMPDKVINSDVLSYHDFFYLFYQYQRRNIVYAMAAKLNGDGKLMQDPIELDTTQISTFVNNAIYTITNSDDKQRIMVSKVNSRNQNDYILTTSLFDGDLNLLNKARNDIPMPNRNDYLTEFNLANNGDFVLMKPSGSQNNSITGLTLITKNASADTLSYYEINIPKIYLNDVKIKVDNINNHYLLTSFFSKQRRGNIDGLYCLLWDNTNGQVANETTTTFSDEIRNNAKSEGSLKNAFNDFFIQNILFRRDGGYAIATESLYSSSRGIYNNRWDYYSSPFSPLSDYYFGSPLYSSYHYPWGRWGGYTPINRYYADNIALMSFDSSANIEWTNVIHKSQYDDYTDNFIGYGVYNSGSEVHFLFNQLERRAQLLTDQSITPEGQVTRSPTLRNLDKDYQFMPRYSKQVSANEIILPCQYRNFICFAKVEF